VNGEIDRGVLGAKAAAAILPRLQELDEILGIMNFPPAAAPEDGEIQALVQAREAARKERDWAAADRLRDDLAARGIEVTDTPAGPRWRRR